MFEHTIFFITGVVIGFALCLIYVTLKIISEFFEMGEDIVESMYNIECGEED